MNVTPLNGCGWTATSDSSWLTLTAATQGTASGPIAFHADANDTTTSSRTGIITIGDQKLTVTQSGSACSYPLSAPSAGFTVTAGDGSVNVTTVNGCNWTATSDSSWLTLDRCHAGERQRTCRLPRGG